MYVLSVVSFGLTIVNSVTFIFDATNLVKKKYTTTIKKKYIHPQFKKKILISVIKPKLMKKNLYYNSRVLLFSKGVHLSTFVGLTKFKR